MALPDFDLLGDPIPEGWGKRGRPPHVPTEQKRRICVVLLAFGRTEEEVADALAITPPTLRKHYFRELRDRRQARARLDGQLLGSLLSEIEKGNVSAIDKMFKRLDRQDMMTGRAPVLTKPAKSKKLGKKEERVAAAQEGTRNDGEWGSLLKH